MVISEIEIKNFKSFEDVCVKLGNFNVVVGASASGKSNFVEAFQFLKDICNDFDAAMNVHGGHFLQNINLSSAAPSCIKATIGNGEPFLTRVNENNDEIRYSSIEYELCISFTEDSSPSINETVRFNFKTNGDENSLLLINQGELEEQTWVQELRDARKGTCNIVLMNVKDDMGALEFFKLDTTPAAILRLGSYEIGRLTGSFGIAEINAFLDEKLKKDE